MRQFKKVVCYQIENFCLDYISLFFNTSARIKDFRVGFNILVYNWSPHHPVEWPEPVDVAKMTAIGWVGKFQRWLHRRIPSETRKTCNSRVLGQLLRLDRTFSILMQSFWLATCICVHCLCNHNNGILWELSD